MRTRTALLAMAVALCVAASLSTGLAAGRGFVAFYDYSDVQENETAVLLTLTVRVFNFTESEAVGAVISVEDANNPEADFGQFEPVLIPPHGSVVLSAQLNISTEEFARWQEWRHPLLRIDYETDNGEPRRSWPEVSRKPVREEE